MPAGSIGTWDMVFGAPRQLSRSRQKLDGGSFHHLSNNLTYNLQPSYVKPTNICVFDSQTLFDPKTEIFWSEVFESFN